MRFERCIDYPAEQMAMSRKRLEARGRFRYVDRVPVLYCVVPRFFAPLFGLRYLDFFRDPETHYYRQLQFAKWRIENIPEDFCTAPVINISPYFDNVIPPSGHGGEVEWSEDGPPGPCPSFARSKRWNAFRSQHQPPAFGAKPSSWGPTGGSC